MLTIHNKISHEHSILTKPMIAPVDKSIPAVIITIATPTATIPAIELSRNILKILFAVKKLSFVIVKRLSEQLMILKQLIDAFSLVS